MSSKRRTDLKIWPSKAKNLEEFDFGVRKSLAPRKSAEKWKDIRKVVKNLQGKAPDSEHAVKNAFRRVSNAGPKRVNPAQTLPKPFPTPPQTLPKPFQNAPESIKNGNFKKRVKKIWF